MSQSQGLRPLARLVMVCAAAFFAAGMRAQSADWQFTGDPMSPVTQLTNTVHNWAFSLTGADSGTHTFAITTCENHPLSPEPLDLPGTVEYNSTTWTLTALGFPGGCVSLFGGMTGQVAVNRVASITIPDTVVRIEDDALSPEVGGPGNLDLPYATELVIPDSVTYIGGRALGLTGVTRISVPSDGVTFGNEAFASNDDDSTLKTVYFRGSYPASVGADIYLNRIAVSTCVTMAGAPSWQGVTDLADLIAGIPGPLWQSRTIRLGHWRTSYPWSYWTDDNVRDSSWPTGPAEFDPNSLTYYIYTPEQLGQLAWIMGDYLSGPDFNGCTVVLMNDLDLSAHMWSPFGTVYDRTYVDTKYFLSRPFSGTFDGAGHTIRGMTVGNFLGGSGVSRCYEYLGLFAWLYTGTVKDLNLTDIDISDAHQASAIYYGGIAGSADLGSLIQNCTVSGTIVDGFFAGGIVGGAQSAIIKDCRFSGIINGSHWTGGIVGNSGYSLIDGCAVSGKVGNPQSTDCGGIAGYAFVLDFFNCDNAATVGGAYYGEDFGYNGATVCYGGIAGEAYDGTVVNCRNSGTVMAYNYSSCLGGIIGRRVDSHGDTPLCPKCYNCLNVGKVYSWGDYGWTDGIGNGAYAEHCYWKRDPDGIDTHYPVNVTDMWGSSDCYSFWDAPGMIEPQHVPVLDGLQSYVDTHNNEYFSSAIWDNVYLRNWTLDGSPDGYPVLEGMYEPVVPGDETWVHIDAIQVSALSGVTLAWDYQPVQSRLGTPSFSYTIETSTDLASWQALVTLPVLSRVGNIERAIVPTNGDRMFFRVKAYK